MNTFQAESVSGEPRVIVVKPHIGRDSRIILSALPQLSIDAATARSIANTLLALAEDR